MAGMMPIGDFRVTYIDGTSEDAASNFLGLVEVERRWPGQEQAPGITALATATWFYLGCPDDDLDKWLSRVHLIERLPDAQDEEESDEDEDEGPTTPAVGAA
jgi:hypothetical protein